VGAILLRRRCRGVYLRSGQHRPGAVVDHARRLEKRRLRGGPNRLASRGPDRETARQEPQREPRLGHIGRDEPRGSPGWLGEGTAGRVG
jgi:hypothetical protein